MSIWADVIQFPLGRLQEKEDFFSSDDESLVSNLLTVIANEMITGNLNYEARARLYFYLNLHGSAIQRWVNMLSCAYSPQARHLSQQLSDTFQRVTSPLMLEEGQNGKVYFDRVVTLSGGLHSLLQVIRSQ